MAAPALAMGVRGGWKRWGWTSTPALDWMQSVYARAARGRGTNGPTRYIVSPELFNQIEAELPPVWRFTSGAEADRHTPTLNWHAGVLQPGSGMLGWEVYVQYGNGDWRLYGDKDEWSARSIPQRERYLMTRERNLPIRWFTV